jgi:MFS-type transporter involved in bile tolerance (Atg22 family)
VVGELTHNPRASILSVEVFFALGVFALSRVDVGAGTRAARAEDAAGRG